MISVDNFEARATGHEVEGLSPRSALHSYLAVASRLVAGQDRAQFCLPHNRLLVLLWSM